MGFCFSLLCLTLLCLTVAPLRLLAFCFSLLVALSPLAFDVPAQKVSLHMVLSKRRICFKAPKSRVSWHSAFLCSGPVVVLRGGHDLQAGIPLLHGRGTRSPTSLLVRVLFFFRIFCSVLLGFGFSWPLRHHGLVDEDHAPQPLREAEELEARLGAPAPTVAPARAVAALDPSGGVHVLVLLGIVVDGDLLARRDATQRDLPVLAAGRRDGR